MTETSPRAESVPNTSPSPSNGGSSNGKAVISVASTGGSFSLEEFARATGQSFNDPGPDLEEESSESQITGTTSSSNRDEPLIHKNEGEQDDSPGEEEESLSTEEATDEPGGQKTSKAIRGKTKDGKEVSLPEDLVISWVVDGEQREIPLKEHLNVVAGELTVNQRLGKVATLKEQLDKERKRVSSILEADQSQRNEVLRFVKEGKPEQALCYLAELNGTSPVELYRHFLNNIVNAFQQFEGKAPSEIDAWFFQKEAEWYREKEKKQAESMKREQGRTAFIEKTVQALEKEGLSADEFNKAVAKLSETDKFKAMGPDQALDEAIEYALYQKHSGMVLDALEKIDQKLLTNKDLINLLLEQTNPHDYTVDDLVAVVKDVLGAETARIATNLSRKVQGKPSLATSQKKSGARQDKRTFRAVSDMAKQFGF